MNVFEAAAAAWKNGRRAAFATVIAREGSAPRSSGARMLVREDGTSVGSIGGGAIEHRVTKLALEVIATGRPTRFVAHLTRDLGMCCGGAMEVYVEPLQIREPFVVFGAGHIAHAIAPLLTALDFSVTIVDERPDYAVPDAFPSCTVRTGSPVDLAREQNGSADAWWLILTHDHRLDEALCEVLLPKPCAWIGMIGSRAKVAKFLMRLRDRGLSGDLIKKLSAPVGLDIGAETPAEIAVAIAAEVVRARRGALRAPFPLSEIELAARGGDGKALAPALAKPEPT